MNSHESVKARAKKKGALDALKGIEYNSESLDGSLWDKYYRQGYEATTVYLSGSDKNQTPQDKNKIMADILKTISN